MINEIKISARIAMNNKLKSEDDSGPPPDTIVSYPIAFSAWFGSSNIYKILAARGWSNRDIVRHFTEQLSEYINADPQILEEVFDRMEDTADMLVEEAVLHQLERPRIPRREESTGPRFDSFFNK